jgi:hypothetical protein
MGRVGIKTIFKLSKAPKKRKEKKRTETNTL